jgi:hypothetical protein
MHITANEPIAQQVRVVLLNGTDVTALTTEVDTKEGWVKLLLMGANGRILLDSGSNPITLQVHGRVVVGFHSVYVCPSCGLGFEFARDWVRHIAAPHFVADERI